MGQAQAERVQQEDSGHEEQENVGPYPIQALEVSVDVHHRLSPEERGGFRDTDTFKGCSCSKSG